MAAPLKPDVVGKIDLLLSAGMRNVRDIQVALRNQGIRAGHVAIGRRKERWLDRRDEASGDDAAPRTTPDVPGATTPDPIEPEGVKVYETSGDKARIECVVHSGGGVVTEEDLVRVCEIDLARWRVVKMRVKAYQTGMKLAEKEGVVRDETGKATIHKIKEVPHVVQLYSVSADLERAVPKAFDSAVTDFFEQFRAGVEPLPPVVHVAKGRRVMAEFDLCDVHFGKLAYHRESGQNYDLRIAERVFANAVEDLIDASRGREIELIRVPLGNDYTHIDDARGGTANGTIVDTDGRLHKINSVALWSMYRAAERWRSIAPTELVLVRGNHDWNNVVGIAQALHLKFDGDDSVTVDVEPAARKYRIYGRTLTGYQHGDEARETKVAELPALMMKEAPKDWLAEAEHHEWHLGHEHREKKFVTKDTDTGLGVVMRWLHSLSAADEWHYRKAFIGARRAAEVYFYDREKGYRGHELALARD